MLDQYGYSHAERARIESLKNSGTLPSHCPNGHFWLRDYPQPVRNCPFCGARKPWADSIEEEQLNASATN